MAKKPPIDMADIERKMANFSEKELNKAIDGGLRSVAGIVLKKIRHNNPRSLSKAFSVVKVKAKVPTVQAGLYKKAEMPAWYKAYWRNFGTLSRRDPGHEFVKGRRTTSSAWKGGIKPRQGVGKAIAESQGEATAALPEAIAKAAQRYFDKLNKK